MGSGGLQRLIAKAVFNQRMINIKRLSEDEGIKQISSSTEKD